MFEWLCLGLQGALAIRGARIDWFTHRLPNQVTGAIALIGGIGYWGQMDRWIWLWFAVVGAHLLLVLIGPQGLGAGDLKLIAGLSPAIIVHNLLSHWLLLSYALGASQAALRIGSVRGRIPFGPALIAGWWLVLMGDFAHAALAYCGRITWPSPNRHC